MLETDRVVRSMRPRTNPSPRTELAKAVKSLREDVLRVTQQQMSNLLGTTLNTIARWENDDRTPGSGMLLELARIASNHGRSDLAEHFGSRLEASVSNLVFEAARAKIDVERANLLLYDLANLSEENTAVADRVRECLKLASEHLNAYFPLVPEKD